MADELTGDLLRRHLRRTGADRAAHTDPTANLQVAILHYCLDLTRSACDDEGIDPEVTRRILERVIYGATPSPVEVEQREQLMNRLIDAARIGPTRLPEELAP